MTTFVTCPVAPLPNIICGCSVKCVTAGAIRNVRESRRPLINLCVLCAPFEGRYICVLFMCNVERMFSMFVA